jgi:hypothetical protein
MMEDNSFNAQSGPHDLFIQVRLIAEPERGETMSAERAGHAASSALIVT